MLIEILRNFYNQNIFMLNITFNYPWLLRFAVFHESGAIKGILIN